MALRLRRGTDAERQSITPKSGELLYVTDTGLVYVGDGITQGGSPVGSGSGGNLQSDPNPTLSANLNLNGNAIIGSGDIDIEGSISATGSIAFDTVSSSLIPTTDSAFNLGSTTFRWQNGHFTGLFVDGDLSVDGVISASEFDIGSIFGDDSTAIFDPETGTFVGNFKGSLLADDSTILIDGDTGNAILGDVVAENIITNTLSASEEIITPAITSPSNFIEVSSNAVNTSMQFNITSNNRRSTLRLSRESLEDSSEVRGPFGTIFFERKDSGGSLTSSIISGGIEINSGNGFILLGVDKEGTHANEANFLSLFESEDGARLGIRNFRPDETLDVIGSASFSEYVIFGTYTTAERNEIAAQNGMVIYNSTDNRFQGYQNNSWINLDNGSSA